MVIDKKIKTGSDFCGVGAFDQALKRLKIKQDKKFACDWDKFARQTYILNYGEPKYFPKDVYDREIPKESLDIYMTSPPCQAFSNAGNRLGEEDERGILFYNSHNFIEVNKPRFFIFENVKGLISHDKGNAKDEMGRTFRRWLDYLGGKSVNGNPMMFPHERSVPYHIYYFVLNAKEHNIPQNRERVFIVGIRDDKDNIFDIPKTEQLKVFLKDCLEDDVDDKYFLTEKQIKSLSKPKENFNGKFDPIDVDTKIAKCITTNAGNRHTDNFLIIKANTKKGFEILKEGDSVNLSVPTSKTRRGRIGHNVAQTLDTQCNQGVLVLKQRRTEKQKENRKAGKKEKINDREFYLKEQNYSDTILANPNHEKESLILDLNYDFPKLDGRLKGGKWDAMHEQSGRVYDEKGIAPTIHTMGGGYQEPKVFVDKCIRKLTPRECFRCQDFPESFRFEVSDRQAYKQAGNSIPVGLLVKIIEKLKL